METLLLVGNFALLVAIGIGILLTRKYLPTYFAKKAENLATKEDIATITEAVESVKTSHAAELEHLRHELDVAKANRQAEIDRASFEHQTHFSWYHEKRMQVHAQVYRHLDITADRVRDLVSPMQFGTDDDRARRHRETNDQYNELVKAYFPDKIFLDEGLCAQLDEVIKTIRMALIDWGMSQSEGFKQTKEGLLLWSEASRIMDKDVPAILKQLEKKFRSLVSSKPPAA